MDEQLLIEGCKHNKSWACKKLYKLYAPVMIGVCTRYTGDRDIARDIMQDGFIKVFTKIHTYSGTGSFAGWIRRIFVTTSLEYLKSNNKSKGSINSVELENIIDEMDISALDKLSAEELLSCIMALPEGYRTVFNLFAIEGYSHSDIAEILNIKEVTSRTQFIRARKVLQNNILSLTSGNSEKERRA